MNVSSRARTRPAVLSGSSGRFAATLVVALIATKPGFERALSDGTSLPGALARFLVAFVVLWLVGGVASVLLHRDAAGPDPVTLPEMVPGSAGADR